MTAQKDDMTMFVRYRLDKAEEAYSAAELLCGAGQWNAYVMYKSHRTGCRFEIVKIS